MKLKIYDDRTKFLRTKCEPFTLPVDEETKKLGESMVEYLRLSQDEAYARKHGIRAGVGLAAPQIGLTKRLFAVYLEDGNDIYRYALVNPELTRMSVKRSYLAGGEGCLSVPKDHEGYVYRHYRITVKGYDLLQDREVEIKLAGYPAIVFQHEYDHLDGILYYDRIDPFNPLAEDPTAVRI